jgi:hypothetical protein
MVSPELPRCLGRAGNLSLRGARSSRVAGPTNDSTGGVPETCVPDNVYLYKISAESQFFSDNPRSLVGVLFSANYDLIYFQSLVTSTSPMPNGTFIDTMSSSLTSCFPSISSMSFAVASLLSLRSVSASLLWRSSRHFRKAMRTGP